MKKFELIRRLNERLRQRAALLGGLIRSDIDNLHHDHDPAVCDAIDRGFESHTNAVNSQLAEAESIELTHVEDALLRIDEGTYGVCQECDRSIPVGRLRVVPYATCCVRCQRAIEQQPHLVA